MKKIATFQIFIFLLTLVLAAPAQAGISDLLDNLSNKGISASKCPDGSNNCSAATGDNNPLKSIGQALSGIFNGGNSGNNSSSGGGLSNLFSSIGGFFKNLFQKITGLFKGNSNGGDSNSDNSVVNTTDDSQTETGSTDSGTTDTGTTDTPTGETPKGTGKSMTVETTGYYPPPSSGYSSKKEARMEGGALDCRGNKLRTLQNYSSGSYVSVATDPRTIRTGTYFTIDEYPGIKFLACDVGGAIKGKHIDICVNNRSESYKVTGNATIRLL